jgi:predicted glycosyltransferase
MKLKLLDQVNYVRIAAKHHPVKIDPELQDLLEAYQKTEMPENLDEVVDQVQNSIPRYYRVSVSSASRPSPTDLIHEFASFAQKTESEMTHFGFVVVPSSRAAKRTPFSTPATTVAILTFAGSRINNGV